MNIKQGKIKNINKKLMAGLLVFSLMAFPLAGCEAIDTISINNVKYTTNNQGNNGFSVDYKTLEHCSFFEVYNNKLDKRYYTIGLIDEYNGSYFIKVYDIFTQEELKISDGTFKSLKGVNHYLQELDIIKEWYTEEELKEALDEFVETREKNKQLIK